MRVGEPLKSEDFQKLEKDDVIYYLHKGIRLKDNRLKLDLHRFLFIREIIVEGIQVL